jgi:hypothetical protein
MACHRSRRKELSENLARKDRWDSYTLPYLGRTPKETSTHALKNNNFTSKNIRLYAKALIGSVNTHFFSVFVTLKLTDNELVLLCGMDRGEMGTLGNTCRFSIDAKGERSGVHKLQETNFQCYNRINSKILAIHTINCRVKYRSDGKATMKYNFCP